MNEQTFNPGDYVETNTGERGTILSIELHPVHGQYIAFIHFDGGTKGHWLVHNLTSIKWQARIEGQREDWSETNEGHATIYEMAPNLIPADQAARVIYELRLDVQRLNAEAMEYHDKLMAFTNGGTGTEAQDHESYIRRRTRPPQDMVSAWRTDVTNGDTYLGYDAWLAERTEDDVRDYEVTIANTFAATSEEDAARQFVAYLTDTNLTYTVRESYGDGSFGSEYYIDLD